MAVTAVTSTLPVSVVCTGNPPSPGVEPYSITIDGTRSPNAINHVGVTYGVDTVALAEWLAVNAEIALQVKAATQADLDALAAAEGQYGFQLGLTTGSMSTQMVRNEPRPMMPEPGAAREA